MKVALRDIRQKDEALLSHGALMLFMTAYAVCMAMMMQGYTPVGDDLVYTRAMDHYSQRYGPLGWAAYCAGHWLSTNGRLANYLAPVFLARVPQVLTDICVGVSYGALPALMIRSVGFGSRTFLMKTILVAMVVFALPWHDSLLLYDCWLNYVLAAVLSLWWIIEWEHGRWRTWALVLLGCAAGMMHESCGIAVSSGILVRLFNPAFRSRRRVIGGTAYMAAALVCLFSPGFSGRVTAGGGEGTTPLAVALTSDFFLLALCAGAFIMLVWPDRRKTLREVCRGSFALYATAALAGGAISIYSGIPGRSGFFSQVFSLVAIFIMMARLTPHMRCPRRLAGVAGGSILALSLAYIVYALHIQLAIGTQAREVVDMMEKADGGVVFHDLWPQDEGAVLPGICMPLPVRTDVWEYGTFVNEYGRGGRIVILPATFSRTGYADGEQVVTDGRTWVVPAHSRAVRDTLLPASGRDRVGLIVTHGRPDTLATPVTLGGRPYLVLDELRR